jgi:hypothetical protein
MTALPERKVAMLRTMVEAAPDAVVGELRTALLGQAEESALGSVRQMVEAETADRSLRNAVLAPVVAMCQGDGRDPTIMSFPNGVLPLIWRGLKATSGKEVTKAERSFLDYDPDGHGGAPFDQLTTIASRALRIRDNRDFLEAAELCDAARPGGGEQLAACLELAPVVRRLLPRLSGWLTRFTEDATAAALRLAYKDATTISDDAGPRFFAMLAAQLDPPWQVLRFISAVMDKPSERFLIESEAAMFGERVMNELDATVRAVAQVKAIEDEVGARAAAALFDRYARLADEIEGCLTLKRDAGWGRRITVQKEELGQFVKARFREAERLTSAALPNHDHKRAYNHKDEPKLDGPPDAKAVARARALLVFVSATRESAGPAGFTALRHKTIDKLTAFIDHYFGEVCVILRMGVKDDSLAEAFLNVAIDFSELVSGPEITGLLRRRAAAALRPGPTRDAWT